MAKYPEWSDIQYDYPLNIELETKVLSSSFDGAGKEKRRRKFLYPRRNIIITYSDRFLTRQQARTLWQFYLDRGGPFEAFSFFLSGPPATVAAAGVNTYEGEYIAVGNGSTVEFDLPGRSISSETVYHGGPGAPSAYEESDYSIEAGGGADGCDRITFNEAPAAGQILTIDFVGVLRVRCRFMENTLGYQDFYNILSRMGLELKGLLNDE